MKLYKTTIVIWSEYDPRTIGEGTELNDLAEDAVTGESYCSKMSTVAVRVPSKDPDWDGTEFFGDTEEEDGTEHH